MAKKYTRGKYGHKPPPPVRTGKTRSTFDGCAVLVLGSIGFIITVGFLAVKAVL